MSTSNALKNSSELESTDRNTVHDLRAPLVIALGFLSELKIIRDNVLAQLSPETGDTAIISISAANMERMVTEVDTEMGLCIDMMSDSLEELDKLMVKLRVQLQTIELIDARKSHE